VSFFDFLYFLSPTSSSSSFLGEAPRRCRRPRPSHPPGRIRSGDPPSIDLPVLPLARSMTSPVSASAGGRFRLSAPRPGEPVCALRRCLRARLPGEPARLAHNPTGHLGVATAAPASGPSASSAGRPANSPARMDHPSHRLRFRPPEPGWPSAVQRDHCWPRRRTAPFLGSRLTCGPTGSKSKRLNIK